MTNIQNEFNKLTQTETIESLAKKFLMVKLALEKEKALSQWLDELADYNRDYANTSDFDREDELQARDRERHAMKDYREVSKRIEQDLKELGI